MLEIFIAVAGISGTILLFIAIGAIFGSIFDNKIIGGIIGLALALLILADKASDLIKH